MPLPCPDCTCTCTCTCTVGDLRKLSAVQTEELNRFVSKTRGGVIFFSTRGVRSAADEISSGDFDGDLYRIIYNSDVVSLTNIDCEAYSPMVETQATLSSVSSKQTHTPSKGLRPDSVPCPPLTRQQVASSSFSSSTSSSLSLSSKPSYRMHCASSITRDLVMEDRAVHHQGTSYGGPQVHRSHNTSSSSSSSSSSSCTVSPPPHERKLSRSVSDPNHSHHRNTNYQRCTGDLKPYRPSDWIEEDESEFDELLMSALMPEPTTSSSSSSSSRPAISLPVPGAQLYTNKDASPVYCSYPPGRNQSYLTRSTEMPAENLPGCGIRYPINHGQGPSHLVSPSRPGPFTTGGEIVDLGSDSIPDSMKWPIFKGIVLNITF